MAASILSVFPRQASRAPAAYTRVERCGCGVQENDCSLESAGERDKWPPEGHGCHVSQELPHDSRVYVSTQRSRHTSLELKAHSTDGPSLTGWGDENGGCDSHNPSQPAADRLDDAAPLFATVVPLHEIYDPPKGVNCMEALMALDEPPSKRARLFSAARCKPEAFCELMDDSGIHVPRRRRTAAHVVDKVVQIGYYDHDRSSGSPEETRAVGFVWSAAGSPFDERAVAGLLSLRDGSAMT